MAANAVVRARIDGRIKDEASVVLAAMGLTVSDAFRILLTRVVADKDMPFAIKTPNATSRKAMAEADKIIKSRRARFATADALIDDLEKASRKQAH